MAHKTTINGTNYTIKSGKTTINGTNYKINKGKTKINGTNYTIGFTKTIVITGTGSDTDDAKTYVSINGVKYKKAATITVPTSTPILCYMSYNVSTTKTAD